MCLELQLFIGDTVYHSPLNPMVIYKIYDTPAIFLMAHRKILHSVPLVVYGQKLHLQNKILLMVLGFISNDH